jgi:hypothetical protein
LYKKGSAITAQGIKQKWGFIHTQERSVAVSASLRQVKKRVRPISKGLNKSGEAYLAVPSTDNDISEAETATPSN